MRHNGLFTGEEPGKWNLLKWRWHGYQITAWFFILFSWSIFYIFLSPSFNSSTKLLMNITFTFLYANILVWTLFGTVIIPTDKVVFKSQKIIKSGVEYEPQSDESYWMYCQAYSRISSKHWGQCNRWVYNFDHHCKWLNNWIGGRNYIWFICLVIFFLIASTFIFIIWVIYLILYHQDGIDEERGRRINTYISIWGLLVINIFKMAFSGYLLGFHFIVRCKGLTTYKYVLKNREKKMEKLNKKTDALK